MSQKQEAFPFIPAWLDDRDMLPATFRVYAHLCRRGDNSTRIAWPSIDSIGEACKVSRKTVDRALKQLVEDGLIRKTGKPFGGSTRYLILTPNRATTDTIEAHPIESPRPINHPPDDSPIESPETREGYPKKVTQGRGESGQSPPAPSLTSKINPVCCDWRLPELSARETKAVKANRALLDSIPPADWKTLRDFYAAHLPDGHAYHRPRTRSRFIEDIEDIHTHAMNWQSKQPKPKPRPKPSTPAESEETGMTEEEVAQWLAANKVPARIA